MAVMSSPRFELSSKITTNVVFLPSKWPSQFRCASLKSNPSSAPGRFVILLFFTVVALLVIFLHFFHSAAAAAATIGGVHQLFLLFILRRPGALSFGFHRILHLYSFVRLLK